MKRSFRIIIIGILMLALSPKVQGQSTALEPYEGSEHSYGWNGLHNGDSYAFYFTADTEGATLLNDNDVSEFNFITSTTGTVANNKASVSIAWDYGAAANIYYLWIEVSATSGCSNYRYVRVTPKVNSFDLLSENVPVENTVSCPAVSSADGFNPLVAEHDVGTTTLQFKIRREGGNRNWSFEPKLSINPDWNVDVAILSLASASAGNLTADASGLYTVPGIDNEVLVTVVVKNYAGTEQIVSLEVTRQIEDKTNLGDSNSENDKVTHRITVMPVIDGIEGV